MLDSGSNAMVAVSRPGRAFTRLLRSLGNSIGWSLGWFLSLWLILVKFEELGKIELGFFEELNLANHAVILKWEDSAAVLLNLFADFFLETVEILVINY
jgi:hypothetical protein